MNMKECECGNDLLIQMMPQITNLNDFRVWKTGQECKADVLSSPMFLCPVCGRFELPHTSLSGKNRLDPEYLIYEKLLAVTAHHNERITKLGNLEERLVRKLTEFQKRIIQTEKLQEEVLELKEAINKKEKSDVKTGSRGRKSSKPTDG